MEDTIVRIKRVNTDKNKPLWNRRNLKHRSSIAPFNPESVPPALRYNLVEKQENLDRITLHQVSEIEAELDDMKLTREQNMVLALFHSGRTFTEIAAIVNISPSTISKWNKFDENWNKAVRLREKEVMLKVNNIIFSKVYNITEKLIDMALDGHYNSAVKILQIAGIDKSNNSNSQNVNNAQSNQVVNLQVNLSEHNIIDK